MAINVIANIAILFIVIATAHGQENEMDIVFVLDGSIRVNLTEFVREKGFIISLLNKFDIGTKSTNVGIVVYSSSIGDVVSLKPFKEKESLVFLTRELRKLNGGFSTNIGIKTARDMMKDNGRPYAKKVMVVITKGRSEKPALTIEEAALAKKDRIVIIVVGVGENQPDEFEQEIKNIASNSNSVVRVNNFKELYFSVDQTIGVIEDVRQVYICQYRDRNIRCSGGRTINIIQADYGRTSDKICVYPGHPEYTNNTSCLSKTSDKIVKDECNAESQCWLLAVNLVFDNPCEGTYKYLRVIYQCVTGFRRR